MLTHVNVYGITIKLCIYQISCPQTILGHSPLGINLCWHFTGSLIDFSSSSQVRPLLKYMSKACYGNMLGGCYYPISYQSCSLTFVSFPFNS